MSQLAPPQAMTKEEILEAEIAEREDSLRKVRQIFKDYIKERGGNRGRDNARRSRRPTGRRGLWAKRS